MLLRTILAFAALLSSGSHALQCYRCKFADPNMCAEVQECADSNPSYMENIRMMYFPNSKNNFSDPKKLPKSVCVTAVYSDKNGEMRSQRECSPLGKELTCEVLRIEATNANSELSVCDTCNNKDFCNLGTIRSPLLSLLLTTLLILFRLL